MIKQLPYEPTTHTIPMGRVYVGYDLTIKCRSSECEDEAVEVVRAFASRGARIVRYMLSIPYQGFRSAFLIVDATGRKGGYAREILEFIKNISVVEDVEFSPRYRNIIFTRALDPVLIAGKRSMINSLEYARGIAVRLYNRLGKNLAPILIRALGEEVGKSLAEGYSGIINPNLKVKGDRGFR